MKLLFIDISTCYVFVCYFKAFTGTTKGVNKALTYNINPKLNTIEIRKVEKLFNFKKQHGMKHSKKFHNKN